MKPQTTVRDEEGPYNLDGLWKSELTLAHFPVAEQPRREMRHNAVVIELEQASRYGEREDDRAAVRLHSAETTPARRCTQPRTKRAPASPTHAQWCPPNTRASPAKAGD